MVAERKRIEFLTPKGIFAYPSLHAPNFGTEEHPKEIGAYTVSLVLDRADSETEEFIKKLEPHYEEAIAIGEEKFANLSIQARKSHGSLKKNPLFVERYHKETEELTGEIEFRCGMNASGVIKYGKRKGEKWTRQPAIFDAKGNKIHNVPEIWGGTLGKLSIRCWDYFISGSGTAGLKLGLQAAQIIHLVQRGERSAQGYGFAPTDGFEQEEELPKEHFEMQNFNDEDF